MLAPVDADAVARSYEEKSGAPVAPEALIAPEAACGT
jgi:hypothetical protein